MSSVVAAPVVPATEDAKAKCVPAAPVKGAAKTQVVAVPVKGAAKAKEAVKSAAKRAAPTPAQKAMAAAQSKLDKARAAATKAAAVVEKAKSVSQSATDKLTHLEHEKESKALKANLLKNLKSEAKAAAAAVKAEVKNKEAAQAFLTSVLAVAADARADDPEALPTVNAADAQSQFDAATKALADANAYAEGIATAIKAISANPVGAEKLRLALPEGSKKPKPAEC